MGTTRKTTKGESPAPRRARRTSASDVIVAERTVQAAVGTPSSKPSLSDAAPISHDEIAMRAYELFVASGYQHGNELQHWLAAEAELRATSRQARS